MVIDTGVFIEHIRAKNKFNTTLFYLPNNASYFISSISIYELFMGATSANKEDDFRYVIRNIKVLAVDEAVAIKAGEIYHILKRKNKLIEFRDIFIAATCIVNNQPLATLNKKHFERIDELKPVNF